MNTRLLMPLHVNVATPQNIGDAPHGTRRTVSLSGLNFDGPRLRGTVLSGGSADWLLLRADTSSRWTSASPSRPTMAR